MGEKEREEEKAQEGRELGEDLLVERSGRAEMVRG